ncbi:hypothetical protein K491DRAFT_698664 [Lophiostoma macrostomum CBS 122681]|uniref:Uncharacterized protein n=1 Tax=Lophiostoma macrostomum CBS 122681 TaxID=1314788 RepID=A0A6A6SLP4_9PLEO|nr:hypothetical protein K491DRAFT_698664 [Lophiostoma macrostomum CBS 122681]
MDFHVASVAGIPLARIQAESIYERLLQIHKMLSDNIVYMAEFAVRPNLDTEPALSSIVTSDFLVGRHIALAANFHKLVSKLEYPKRGTAFLDIIDVSSVLDRKTKWLLENHGVESDDEVAAFFGKLARAYESALSGAVSYLLGKLEGAFGQVEIWKAPHKDNFEVGFAQLALSYTYGGSGVGKPTVQAT